MIALLIHTFAVLATYQDPELEGKVAHSSVSLRPLIKSIESAGRRLSFDQPVNVNFLASSVKLIFAKEFTIDCYYSQGYFKGLDLPIEQKAVMSYYRHTLAYKRNSLDQDDFKFLRRVICGLAEGISIPSRGWNEKIVSIPKFEFRRNGIAARGGSFAKLAVIETTSGSSSKRVRRISFFLGKEKL